MCTLPTWYAVACCPRTAIWRREAKLHPKIPKGIKQSSITIFYRQRSAGVRDQQLVLVYNFLVWSAHSQFWHIILITDSVWWSRFHISSSNQYIIMVLSNEIKNRSPMHLIENHYHIFDEKMNQDFDFL